MGRRNKPKGPFRNSQQSNSQKSKAERTEDLVQQEKNQINAALITDERVAAKIAELDAEKVRLQKEYDDKKAALEEEYKSKEKTLQEKIDEQQLTIDERSDGLDTQKKLQEQKAQELAEQEAQVKRKCETAVAEEVKRIRDDERQIREQEKDAVYAEWEADKAKQKKELATYLKQQREKADAELEAAHAERIAAEEKKREMIREADADLEKKQAALTAEYKSKLEVYTKKKQEFEEKLQDLEEQKAELDADTEYVKGLKVKYSQYSETEVLKLQQQIQHYEAQIEVYITKIKELMTKTAHMQGSLLDDDGQSLVVRIEELEAQLAEATAKNDQLANMPSEEEIERLRSNTQELEVVKIALDDEKQKRHEAEAKISAYAMSARELENARVAAAALESLNNQLQMKLKYISEQYKTTQESKFKVLLDIDQEVGAQGLYNPKGFGNTLQALCDYVRDYGAYNKGLYYSIETIRVFFASLAAAEKASRLLILQGLSGTGKSSLPRLVAEALGVECKLVPVQPSWRDNRELLGYDNDFTNRFKETEFTKFLYEASALPNRKKIYLIVLDEVNLARIEYYFADFLSVLEKPNQSEWVVPLVSGYSELDEDQKPKYLDYSNEAANICVTNNIWFVGTANNDDSTSLITDKVYDRAQVLDMDNREDPFEGKRVTKVAMDVEELLNLFQNAKVTDKMLSDDDRKKIKQVDDYLKEMDITFGNRIMSQMDDFVPVYIACGGTKEDAIDYLLTHKILRKLDERYEPYLVAKLEELEFGLNEVYGEGSFKQSIAKIHKLRDKIAG